MKVLGYNYTLEYGQDRDRMGACGRCHSSRLYIQVANDMNGEQVESTVLHEVIEALNFHLELGLGHSAVMGLEAGLFQVCQDNGVDLSPLARELGDLGYVVKKPNS